MTETEKRLKSLTAKRTQLKSAGTRLRTYFTIAKNDNKNTHEIKARLAKYINTIDNFEEVQLEIELLKDEEDDIEERANFESQYYALISEINRFLEHNSVNSGSATHVKLPSLELPSFSGHYCDWLTFHDNFNSIIHNNQNLSAVQKLQYLKSSLKGEAAKLVENINISADNYTVAWELLVDRFENKRIIVQSYIKSLFHLPSVIKDSANSLRQLANEVALNLKALKNLKRPTDTWDDLMIYLITTKLDFATKREWENTIAGSKELPALEQMTNFINTRCLFLESLAPTKPQYDKINVVKSNQNYRTITAHLATNKGISCTYCTKDHVIYQCPEFLNLSINTRIIKANELRLCKNCLRKHGSIPCKASRCRTCNGKHNTLLHVNETEDSTSPNSSSIAVNTSSRIDNKLTSILPKQVLLSTVSIYITDYKGDLHTCRALLDMGSQSNFITQKLCRSLKLIESPVDIPVCGIDLQLITISQQTKIRIKSRLNSFTVDLNCLVLPQFTNNLPSRSFPKSIINIPSSINSQLADPEFNVAAPVDILIGAEIFWQLLCVGQVKNNNNCPILHKTHLGWVVGGKFDPCSHDKALREPISCNTSMNSLQEKLQHFWEIEEIPNNHKNPLSSEEAACEEHFAKNHKRDLEGRFIVRLPFKHNTKKLGNTMEQAISRFTMLENKFRKQPQFAENYKAFMEEYKQLGHMELLPKSIELSKVDHYFLPHHGIIKETSLTTKMRVVYDGSAKSTTGISLNDTLMVGPTIQDNLFNILIRFRTHQYILNADISKMYRQIEIQPDDRNFQLITWRDNANDAISIFRLTTVTYGTSSAPFLAVRCLHQLAIENQEQFPDAAKIIKEDFYIDDLLTGTNSIIQAKQLQGQLINILKSGGFTLCKWSSNSPELLLNNDQQNIDKNILINLDPTKDSKILGLIWNSAADYLKYSIQLPESERRITKRSILSLIATIYDPLGLISPLIIIGKILLQQLWTLGSDWDESVPIHIHTAWSQFIDNLKNSTDLIIPRKVIKTHSHKTIELHGFCDSSEKAYGACVYIRIITDDKEIVSQLLCAKSKVAPLKTISLPRLELCGALLLAKLMRNLISNISIKFDNIYYWTDSTIVLSWLKLSPHKLKTFVANRVSQIQTISDENYWFHISSEQNPADILSRGSTAIKLIDNNLWWNGPAILHQENLDNINKDLVESVSVENIPETRIEKPILLTNLVTLDNDILQRYSSYFKLKRVIAYCLRFYHNCRNPNDRKSNTLSTQEINNAENLILNSIQASSFRDEITELKKNKCVGNNSKIKSLAPFLDSQYILRVGGRLKYACVSYDVKHPILLPKNNHVTNLILREAHVRQLHAGPQLTLASIRQKFWPVSGISLIKQIIHKCGRCFRVKPVSGSQLMGDLPVDRTVPSRPFLNCAVDYAGPINIKNGFGRAKTTVKSYIALFICLSTKAIHLELVCDCTSATFLNALKRMMARRGKVKNIYSDNATNFIGANRELNKLFKSPNFIKIKDELALDNINWNFIPSRSPHFGGLWEAGIKSAKFHLKRITSNALLTYEQMHTYLCQIESVLNSRPLTPLSNDPNDPQPLTPGHFLIGAPLMSVPDDDLTTLPINRLSQWQRVQQMTQHFWRRWSTEYITTLQQRKKWHRVDPNPIQVGDVVILKEENLPPLVWRLGRITNLHPGKDGLVRVVSVKVNNSVLKRALNKVCLLPKDL